MRKRPECVLAFAAISALLLSVVACSNEQVVAKTWLLDQSNPPIFTPTLENEIHSFWRVIPGKIDAAIETLRGDSVVAISADDASRLLANVPTFEPEKSLFLIRGIDVEERPIPIRVFESKGVVEAFAGTFSTCFFIKPGARAQPLVVALPKVPSRVIVGYSCDGL